MAPRTKSGRIGAQNHPKALVPVAVPVVTIRDPKVPGFVVESAAAIHATDLRLFHSLSNIFLV